MTTDNSCFSRYRIFLKSCFKRFFSPKSVIIQMSLYQIQIICDHNPIIEWNKYNLKTVCDTFVLYYGWSFLATQFQNLVWTCEFIRTKYLTSRFARIQIDSHKIKQALHNLNPNILQNYSVWLMMAYHRFLSLPNQFNFLKIVHHKTP